jgi:hypothetical protein
MEFLILIGSTTIIALIAAYLLLRAEKKEKKHLNIQNS